MIFRNLVTLTFVLLSSLTLAGCDDGGDERTKAVTPGMTRAEMLAVLQSAGGGDPNAHIWRTAQYLVDGKVIEVLFYSRDNERRTVEDTVPAGKVFPVILADGMVVGAGRAVFDSVAKATSMPLNRY